MPLHDSPSHKAFTENLKAEIAAGKPMRQALAIAYATQKAARKDTKTASDASTSPTPKSAATLIHNGRGQFLFLKRADGRGWSFPGGGIDSGDESPYKAALRECREEIGTYPKTDFDVLETMENGCVYFYAEAPNLKPKLNDESTEFKWAPLDDVPTPLAFPVVDGMDSVEMSDLNKHDPDNCEYGEGAGPGAYTVVDRDANDKRDYDRNGWFSVKNNPISKVGVFPYLAGQVDPTLPKDSVVYVFRSEESLSDPEFLRSLELIPLVDDHTMLGDASIGATPAEKKGVQGTTGQSASFDKSTGIVSNDLKVWSETLKDAISSGKTQLSLGYRCKYIKRPGVFDGQKYDYEQTKLSANHLALVDAGRMGKDVRVLDHAVSVDYESQDAILSAPNVPGIFEVPKNDQSYNPWAALDEDMSDESKSKLDELLEAIRGLVSKVDELMKHKAEDVAPPKLPVEDPEAQLSGKEKDAKDKEDADKDLKEKDSEKSDKDEKSKEEKEKDEKEAKEKEDAAKEEKEKGAKDDDDSDEDKDAMDAVMVLDRKNKAYEKASKLVGSFDHSKMSVNEVAQYACDKLDLTVEPGKETAALDGYFAAATMSTVRTKSIAKKSDLLSRLLGN